MFLLVHLLHFLVIALGQKNFPVSHERMENEIIGVQPLVGQVFRMCRLSGFTIDRIHIYFLKTAMLKNFKKDFWLR